MATEGVSAQGTKVYRSIDPTWPPGAPRGGSVDFVLIGELGNTSGPETRRNVIDLSNHQSAAEEIITGLLRHGELSMNLNWVPRITSHAGLNDALDNGWRDIYKVEFTDNPGGVGTTVQVSGFVTAISPTMPIDDKLSADVTVRPTGGRLVTPAVTP